MLKWIVSPLVQWLIGAGVVATIVGGIWLHGDLHGRAAVKADWNAAILNDERNANDARKKANATVPLNPTPRQLCDSEWNRDPC